MKLFISVLVFFVFIKTNAQWNEIPLKSKFYFSRFLYKLKPVETTSEQSIMDTVWKREMASFTVMLDTIISLDNTRKLIVFSNCIDSLFLHSIRVIKKGKIEHLITNKSYDNLGDSLYERDKATIIYQINNQSYTLTVPSNFEKDYLKNQSSIKDLDAALSSLKMTKDWAIPELLGTLFYKGLNIPCNAFIEFDKEFKNKKYDFTPDFYIYDTTLIEKTKNLLNGKAVDWYGKTGKWVDREIGINGKYGLVESDYEQEDGNTGYTTNIVIHLEKIDYPHD